MLPHRKRYSKSHSMKIYTYDTDSPKKSVIPLRLFQCWHTLDLPPKMRENVELLKRQNPEFEYSLYDDKMCADFISRHFDKEVFYSFNKLKPGAYKADLWRYCVLYIHGGIYLDIKYKCANGFKLLEMTDQEYFVKDRIHGTDHTKKAGIYQALMCSLPKNKELFVCIQKIVYYVKHNLYNNNSLDVTGPHILNSKLLENTVLTFNGKSILRNNNHLLDIYKEYRKEQHQFALNEYYATMWKNKNIYNYPILSETKSIDFTRTLVRKVGDKEITFYSSSPTLIEHNRQFILNLRWINYNYNKDGSKCFIPSHFLSLNSRIILDESFRPISEEVFLNESLKDLAISNGLEDIRLFKYKDELYYNASLFDIKRGIMSTSYGLYSLNHHFELERNILQPSFYDTSVTKIIEKNWSFVLYQEKMRMVYQWFPLQICEIVGTKLNNLEQKNTPEYFKDARGSSPGYRSGSEIWFVLHKAQHYVENSKYYFNYQHFFAVFDLDMNLIRYSELFKLGGCKVEFCIGLIIKEESIILSYSLLDTQSMISVYDRNTINNLKWY